MAAMPTARNLIAAQRDSRPLLDVNRRTRMRVARESVYWNPRALSARRTMLRGAWLRVWPLVLAAALVVVPGASPPARAEEFIDEDPDVELAKKSQNPLGDLISLPFENNFDVSHGPKDALIYTLNLKPAYPVHLGDDWLLINRLTFPIVAQGERFPGEGSEFGLGDSVYQAFFAPRDSQGFGYPERPTGGPNWSVQLQVKLLFPK